MHINSKLSPIFLAALLVAFLSCAPIPLSLNEVSTDANAQQPYKLGAGDKIRLLLYGDDVFSGEYKVSSAGNVSLPLVGIIRAKDKTIDELRDDIIRALTTGYYLDPHLAAEIVEYRPFYIFGEVKRPGNYPYVAGLTLGQAVSIAGGYTYRANTKTLSMQRVGTEAPVRVQSAEVRAIRPGDTIEIMERYF